MKSMFLPIAIAALMLGACNKGPIVVSGAPRPIITNQGSEAIVNRTLAIASDKTLKLNFVTAINPDCTLTEAQPSARATQEPSHGTLVIRKGLDFAFFNEKNPRSACNKTRVPGTIVEYVPEPGYTGPDSLAYDWFPPTGAVVHFIITVNVM